MRLSASIFCSQNTRLGAIAQCADAADVKCELLACCNSTHIQPNAIFARHKLGALEVGTYIEALAALRRTNQGKCQRQPGC